MGAKEMPVVILCASVTNRECHNKAVLKQKYWCKGNLAARKELYTDQEGITSRVYT